MFFRNEGAEAANFAKHGTPFYLVGPDRGAVDGWRGRAQTRESKGDTGDEQNGDGGVRDASRNFFSVSVGWSLNVHDLIHLGKASWVPEQPSCKSGKMNNLGEHAQGDRRKRGGNGIRRPTSEQRNQPGRAASEWIS